MTAITNKNSGAELSHITADRAAADRAAAGRPAESAGLRIHVTDHLVTLTRNSRDEVIWPAWPATTSDVHLAGSPLAELDRDWVDVRRRLRESAKWLSTVLGATLGTIVGASPLADLNGHHLQVIAVVLLFSGLALLSVTLLLILRVMLPGAVSYERVQTARPPRGLARALRIVFLQNRPSSLFLDNPLHRWQRTIKRHKDLYLPCGVTSLEGLRHAMEDEEETLRQLAGAGNYPDAGRQLTGDLLAKVQAARVARLVELRMAAARITSVADGYVLRARCTLAIYGSSVTGTLGTAAIILAFAWPIR